MKPDEPDVEQTVRDILSEIEAHGDDAARSYAERFDGYAGNTWS